jgi:ankyrin repeat protein
VDDIEQIFLNVGLGKSDAVAEILRYRPELSRARDASSLSILQFARYMGQDAILDRLVEAGPPLDIFEAATIDRAADVRALLARDSSLATGFSADGFTALHFAAYFGAINAIPALLEGGAHVEAVTTNFLTNMPLHAAAAGGRIETVRLLLQAGADPNAKQHGGFTALMTAAFANNRELAELLLAFNADCLMHNDEEKSAADVAAGLGNMEIAARLRLEERHVEHGRRRRDGKP